MSSSRMRPSCQEVWNQYQLHKPAQACCREPNGNAVATRTPRFSACYPGVLDRQIPSCSTAGHGREAARCSAGARLPRRHVGRKLSAMRYATLILILVGCTDDLPMSVDDQSSGGPDGEVIGAVPTHGQDCPGGDPLPPPPPPAPPPSGSDPPPPPPPPPADPNPIPAPRDCSQLIDPVECRDCCEWNVDKVWGERCRRLPRKERGECWRDAERRRGECHRECPLVTITVTP
jgi:hypothetical protein